MSDLVRIDGWELVIDADEPRVRDIDIAERAGLSRPRHIRETIQKNRLELEAHGEVISFAAGAGETSSMGGRPMSGYLLNEAQAISLVALMRTPQAMKLRIDLVKVFISYRRGQLAPKASVRLDIAHGPRIGEEKRLRQMMQDACGLASRGSGKSIQAVHGAVRRTYLVTSVYHVSALLWSPVFSFLSDIANQRLILPTRKQAPLRLVARDPRQREMFP